ncbi:hypothetical protein GDO78_011776 [Eleutherodactylus coqui]|uniref:Uncharacterized protein n=1 Tax=Eleutherodactylus coqui TaxID=57060 RepID=A0A8J6K3V9_ELECQ|nr:hypothetical protein GDO78_011776 [Eleutherodactylus coqui]
MKRKQKRFIQMALLFTAALIFLPNIGLWSLYKEKQLMKSADGGDQQPPMQVILTKCNTTGSNYFSNLIFVV